MAEKKTEVQDAKGVWQVPNTKEELKLGINSKSYGDWVIKAYEDGIIKPVTKGNNFSLALSDEVVYYNEYIKEAEAGDYLVIDSQDKIHNFPRVRYEKEHNIITVK